MGRQLVYMALAGLLIVPGVVVSRMGHVDAPDAALALVFGLAIIGAAFMLSWAAEAAQLDISAGLAIAVLAFIAVLPEYAVDLVFALQGGHDFAAHGPTCQSIADKMAGHDSSCALALANMTGSNRLLIGAGLDAGGVHRLVAVPQAAPMTPKGTCRPALAAGTVVEALREHHLQRFSLIVGLLPRHASWNSAISYSCEHQLLGSLALSRDARFRIRADIGAECR